MGRKRQKASWRSSLLRGLLHFPVGCFASWLIMALSWQGVIFAVAWLAYQALEDWRIEDRGYLDVAGFLWGFGMTSAAFAFLFAFGVTGSYFEFLWYHR